MVRLGVWHEDAKVELIDGEIYDVAPVGPAHVRALLSLQRQFERYRERVIVSVQNPLRLETSEPEPDIVLLKPPLERYDDRLPEAQDVLLVVEIADTSLDYDRSRKVPVYARSGIPEVWLLNLPENRLEVYRRPQGERYVQLTIHEEGDAVKPLALDEAIAWWA